jgi:hypothetical protein
MKKYSPLGEYLVKKVEIPITLTFHEIQQILGFSLPFSAYNHRAWWANSLSHPQAGSWMNAGWTVSKVNIKEQIVSFIRPINIIIQKDNDERILLRAIMNTENLLFELSKPYTSANAIFSWRQIVQMLLRENPRMFGNTTDEPDHYVFPEMLAKLGYNVINWETGVSWQG